MNEPRNIGRFKITGELLRRDWRKLLPVFSLMVVVRAEFMYVHDHLEIVAHSDLFAALPDGEMVPDYNIICTQTPEGAVAFSAERIP